MTEDKYRHIFNPLSDRPAPRKVKDVFYSFLSGLNKSKIGGNTSILNLTYETGDDFRCMVDPGDIFGDNRYLEDPSMRDCDTIIADMRAYFDYDDGKAITKAEKPLDMIILSHSHRDHIGAISKLMLMGYKMPPIYATPYTKERLYQHLSNENISPAEWPKVVEVAPGQSIKREGVEIGLFSVSHSTPQSLGIAFKTVEGTIVHTCDFKLDDTVIWGPGFDENQFKRVAGEDISLLLMDSTGADSKKKPVTEHDFRETLRDLFAQHKNKRFIIASHPGFEENMASIAKVVAEHKKTLFIDSWSHEQVFSALHQTGLELGDHIDAPIDIRSLTSLKHQRESRQMKPKDSVVLVAGVLGQKNSSLVRAVNKKSKTLDLDPKTDIILFCGPNMPGQDRENKYILLNEIKKQGFKTYAHPDYKLYPHAHARQSEIKKFAKLVKSKTIVPIHGDSKLREENKRLLEKEGHTVIKAENGQTLRLKGGRTSIVKDKAFKPEFIGFETRSGSHWTDRDYVVKLSVNYSIDKPSNDNDTPKGRRKPRLFGDHRRY